MAKNTITKVKIHLIFAIYISCKWLTFSTFKELLDLEGTKEKILQENEERAS